MSKGNDNDRYVVGNDDRGGFDVVKEGHKRASDHLPTQKEAIARAKEITENLGGGEVRIQGEDGKFRDSDTTKSGRESKTRDTKH
jgi:hypothetical protein